MTKLKTPIIVAVLFLTISSLRLTAATASTNISAKKGVGFAMVEHCNSSTNPTACWQQIRTLMGNLGATWYYTWFVWNAHASKMGNNFEFVPMVSVAGSNSDRSYNDNELSGFKTYARNNPGSYWLIWNEPDYWQQSNIPIDVAARIYKPLREAIKSADPTAKLIIGGMMDHNHWIDWARTFRNSYKDQYGAFPQYEGWHGHMYTCGRNYNKETWRSTITGFRTWINANGGGELWMTEFGCLDYDFPQIITDQFDWMESYNGIQRHAWFVASSKEAGSGFNGGNLFTGTFAANTLALSSLGQTFAQYPINPNASPTPRPSTPPTPTITQGVSVTPSPTPGQNPTPTITPVPLQEQKGFICELVNVPTTGSTQTPTVIRLSEGSLNTKAQIELLLIPLFSYTINFNDGSTINWQNPREPLTHTYTSMGEKTVTLSITIDGKVIKTCDFKINVS